MKKNKSNKKNDMEMDTTQSIQDEPLTDLKDIEAHEAERESVHARNKEMEAISDIVAHDLKKGDFYRKAARYFYQPFFVKGHYRKSRIG